MKRIIAALMIILTVALSLASCSHAKKSYEKLDEHIVSSAQEIDGVRYLTLGENYESDGAVYTRTARRTATEIALVLTVNSGGEALYTFALKMTKDALEVYRWEYSSATGNTMSGMITPDEYIKGAYSLSYLNTNIADSETVASTAGMCQSLCNYLLEKLETDLAALELTAEDFDFKKFYEED